MNVDLLWMIAPGVLVAIVLVPLLWRERQRARAAERRADEAEEAVACISDELALHIEAAREAAAVAARASADREAVEAAAQSAAKREAAEVAARLEVERQAAQAAARAAAEREAAEAAEAAAHAAAALEAAEAAARVEAEREAAEWEARLEAEQLAQAAATVAVVKEPKPPEQTVVMIADDSKVVRIKTSRLLAKHRYQVVMAEDGADAAAQIDNSMPDVLITDVEMPGLDGFELTRHMREQTRTAHIPIIMISSNSATIGARATEAGVSVVMDKPYPEDELIAHIARLMA